jgi:hypothetical protein
MTAASNHALDAITQRHGWPMSKAAPRIVLKLSDESRSLTDEA